MVFSGNIVLVGPMGSGKSTIGRRLAQALGMEFRDSDREIEQRTGADIPLIFELEGEAGFRARERAMIEQLTELDGVVLATGGGSILDEDNRRCLGERGTVIYLQTSVEQQLQRTARDQNRPLLQTENPRERLESLLAQRDPLYRQTADMIIDTDGRTVNSVVNEILRRLGVNAPRAKPRRRR